jgi:hypothetical protein
MTKDSAIIKMAHSAAKFATINPMADNVDAKIFAFIGDRLKNQEPRAILIPTNAWLTWPSHKVANDEKTMLDHYKDKKNYGDLYQETGGKVLKQVPNILAIPLIPVRLFELHKKGKMPHECLNLLLSHINDPNNIGDKTEWNLIQDWLITATYCDGKKRKKLSMVGIDIKGVMCGNDEVREWIGNCLDETIGCRRKPTPKAMPPPQMAHHTLFPPQNMPP